MAKLNDFSISDFSGGIVRNKDDKDMERNEMKNTLNLDVDEQGKIKRRRGYQRFATTASNSIFNGIFTQIESLGSAPTRVTIIANNDDPIDAYNLVGDDYLTTALADGATTAVVGSNSGFAASGTIEVGGDLIEYTSLTGGATFNITETDILSGALYPVGTPVRQWSAARTTNVNGVVGIYFAVLNNIIFVNGRTGSSTTTDGVTYSPITDADEAAGIFATNYRDRIYLAGSGATDGAGTRNGSSDRISFSDAGDSTSWDINNFFDVEDQRGEPIQALKVSKDKLWIFKTNSTFYYDEVNLKQTLFDIGAYSHRCVQEIDGLLYTFCPSGVFVTNGFEAKRISDPIKEYIKDFRPTITETTRPIVTNTFSGVYDKKYILYIGDILSPSTLNDVVLVYDTIKKNWTVYDSIIDFQCFLNWPTYTSAGRIQQKEAFFGGDNAGIFYQLFHNQTIDTAVTPVVTGGDIIANNISNSTGTSLSTITETPFYDLGFPGWWKKFGYLRAIIEQGEFNIQYRLDKGSYLTDWISLGDYKGTNIRKKISNEGSQILEDEGYRIAFRITSNSRSTITILNELIIEDSETLTKQQRHGTEFRRTI